MVFPLPLWIFSFSVKLSEEGTQNHQKLLPVTSKSFKAESVAHPPEKSSEALKLEHTGSLRNGHCPQRPVRRGA